MAVGSEVTTFEISHGSSVGTSLHYSPAGELSRHNADAPLILSTRRLYWMGRPVKVTYGQFSNLVYGDYG